MGQTQAWTVASSSPYWAVCLPLPAAGCGVTGAGTGCHRDLRAATASPVLPTRAEAPGANTECLRCCPTDGNHQHGSWKPCERLWGMGLGRLVGIGRNGERTPAGTLPKRVPILPPPPPTPAVPQHPLPCCLRPPRREGALIPHLPKAGRKDGKLHTTVSGKLPAHLHSILPLRPRAFPPTSFFSLRCCYKDISGSKEVNVCGRRRRGRAKRFP